MLPDVNHLETDVLVLGTGGAGLAAAVAAREAGARVMVASKMGPDDPNCTVVGWGGITYATEAHADELFRQVVETGGFLNDQRLVEQFARQVPQRVAALTDLGVPLEVLDEADTRNRLGVTKIVGQGRTTGFGLTRPLRARAEALGTRFIDHLMISTLLVVQGAVVGAAGVDLRSGQFVTLAAGATIIATGGGACLWARTDNPPGTTGDGIALAYEAGAELVDLECVSFTFPRSRFEELLHSGGRDPEPFLSAGGAHYFLGGIRIDERGRATVPGLYAAGEAAGGLFGAGRLGGSALADTIVFGAIAGENAAAFATSTPRPRWDATRTDQERARLEALLSGSVPAAEVTAGLRSLMWRKCGLTKAARSLEEAREEVAELESRRADLGASSVAGLREALECGFMLTLARLIITASLRREESRGAFWRLDAPEPDNARWVRNIVLRREQGEDCLEVHTPVMARLKEPSQPRIGPGCFDYLP